MKRCFCFGVLALTWLLAGCIPAKTPDVLNFTPGAPVTITQGQVVTPDFIVINPLGWKVVTGEAGAPSTLYLVAPGGKTYIVLTAGSSLAEPNDGQRHESRRVGMVSALFSAADNEWDTFYPTWQLVLATLIPA